MDTIAPSPHADERVETGAAPAPAAPSPQESWWRRLSWPARTAIKVVAGVLIVLFLIWAMLFITKGRFLKHPFERIAGRMMNREVKVQGDFQLYFAPINVKFVADGFSISNPKWASRPQLFKADHLYARLSTVPLIFGHRRIKEMELVNGAGDLEWNAQRRNTWTFSDKPGKPFEWPVIERASVTGTTLRYIDPQLKLLADLKVADIAATDARVGKAVGITGTGRIRETPFTLVARLLSPDATVRQGENKLVATMRAAGNTIDVSGTLPSLADVEDVPLQTRARGGNMASLLGIIGVVLPNTRDYDVHARMVKDGNAYRFTRMAGTFGDSDLAGTLTITNGDRLKLDSTLKTKSLDIVDAAPFIGYNPDIVASKGAMAAAAATGAGPQRILPDAELPVATMQRFDADLKWTIGAVKSKNVPISDIDLTLALDRGRLALSPLSFTMARGHLSSDIVFDTRQRPAADSYDIRLAPTPMGRLLAGYGVAESGTSGTVKGRIQLKGRGDTIHDSLASASGRIAFIMPKGTFWTRNVQLAEIDVGTFVQKMFEHKLKEPVQINCGLIGFTVRNGVAAADPILIDTSKNVMLGRGGFSFKTEGVDLAFRADGKKFSVFSGQSPVGINGSFAQPGIDVISPQLLARAGAGLGLALVASPVAGVLAFVDVGDAKSTACGPVLAGATAKAQRTTKGKPRDDVGHGTTAKAESGKKSSDEKKKQRKKFLGIF